MSDDARHEQPDVDAIPGRRTQRLHVRRRPREIRVGQPQGAARQCRDQLVDPEEAGRVRHRRDDAHGRVTAFGNGRLVEWRRDNRLSGGRPGFRERGFAVCHGGTTQLDTGVAPWIEAPRWITRPTPALRTSR